MRGILIITLVGAIARFATLDVQSFWFDEALTVGLVNDSFGDMIDGVMNGQAQPPPYFVLGWLWVKVFGSGEVGLRSLSALLGTLTIPVAWAAAKQVASERVALVVAALTALSPPLIWYSQEARGYALVVFCSTLSLLFFLRVLNEGPRRDRVWWVAASIAAVASHYFALFLVVPEAAWLVWRVLERRVAVRYVGALGIGLLALSPVILYQREHGGAEWIGQLKLYPRVRDATVFFVGGPLLPQPLQERRWMVMTIVAVVAVLALIAGLRWTSGQLRSRLVAVTFVGAAAVAIPLLGAAVGSDFVLDRNFLPAWVPLSIAVAVGLSVVPLRWVGGTVVGLTLAFFVVMAIEVPAKDALQRDHWREIARDIGPPRSDRVIETVPFWQGMALEVYTPGTQRMRTPRRVSSIVTVSYIGFLPFNNPIQPPPLPPPFREVRRFYRQAIEVVEYWAPSPVEVDPAPLIGVGRNHAEPLFQPAASD